MTRLSLKQGAETHHSLSGGAGLGHEITCPIMGPRTLEQMQTSLTAIEITLTDDDYQRLDAVAPPGRVTVPYYGDGWNWGPNPFRW